MADFMSAIHDLKGKDSIKKVVDARDERGHDADGNREYVRKV